MEQNLITHEGIMLAGDIVSLPTRLPTRTSYLVSYSASYLDFLLGLPIWESYSGTLLGAPDAVALLLGGEVLRIYIGALCPP
jgi:hypothetical protein